MISNVNHGVRQCCSRGRPQAEFLKTGNKVNRAEKAFAGTSQGLSYSQSINYTSGNYSYSSQLEFRYDSVSIGGNGVVSPLHSFFNNLTDAMGGLFDTGGMIDQGYGSMESPFAFAGQLLNRIKAELAGAFPGGGTVAPEPPVVPEMPVDGGGETVPEAVVASPPPEAVETAPVAQPPEPVEPEVVPAGMTDTGAEAPLEAPEEAPEEAPAVPWTGDAKAELLQMIEQRVERGYRKTVVELQARENPAVPEKSEKEPYDDVLVPVNKARSLVRHGLRSLRQNSPAPAPVGFSHGFIAGDSETRIVSLQVFTRDGDLVNIEIGSARSAFMGGAKAGDGSTLNMFVGAMAGGMEFSVEGDLDDGELGAIADLLEKINDLARAFFGSDLQAALGMAMELGFDREELTGFALDLNQRKTSFAALREQGGGGSVPITSESGAQPVLDTISGFGDMARNLMNHAILDLFEQPVSFVTDMFDALTVEDLFDPDGTTENPESQLQQPGVMDRRWGHELLSQMGFAKSGEGTKTGAPEDMAETDGVPVIDQFL
ncbi:MAG: hypothetical protein GY737_13310 [Desulfobacteraceae bacterium]|nr:hypothetical protein [Desulfobacteraceae bacterium]